MDSPVHSRVSGHGVLQPILYSGNTPGLFYFRDGSLRFSIPEDPAGLLGSGLRLVFGIHARHQGDQYPGRGSHGIVIADIADIF